MWLSETEALAKLKEALQGENVTLEIGSREFDSPQSQQRGKLTFWVQSKTGNTALAEKLVDFAASNIEAGWFFEGSEVSRQNETAVDIYRISVNIGYRI